MTKQQKKELKTCIVTVFIFIVLLALSIGMYFAFDSYKESRSVTVDGNKCYSIHDESSFLKALAQSATIKDKKTTYCLTAENIKVAADKLPAQRTDFYGTLNGRGRTLTIVAGENALNLTQPIFNALMRNSVIKQLNIVVEAEVGGDEAVKNAAVLANSNYGSITDCSVTVKNIVIGSDCKEASALVLHNFETISRVCLKVDNVSSTISKTANWQCRFGTVTTVNHKAINNILIDVNFHNDMVVFDSEINNQYVGYVVGGVSGGNEVKVENIYLFNSDVRFAMSSDGYIFKGTGYNIVENFGKELDGILKDQNGWTELVWKFNGQTFPSLILEK